MLLLLLLLLLNLIVSTFCSFRLNSRPHGKRLTSFLEITSTLSSLTAARALPAATTPRTSKQRATPISCRLVLLRSDPERRRRQSNISRSHFRLRHHRANVPKVHAPRNISKITKWRRGFILRLVKKMFATMAW